jgi:hypothetical protein
MSSDRQMPATARMRSPSKRRLPRIAPLVPFLPQATCRFWLLGRFLKSMQNVCNRAPHLSEEPGGSHGRHDHGRYTLSRHVSECVLHSRRYGEDVTSPALNICHPILNRKAHIGRGGDVELMPQKEVLNFKPAPRLEQIGDKCGQQMEDREHRTG